MKGDGFFTKYIKHRKKSSVIGNKYFFIYFFIYNNSLSLKCAIYLLD